IPFGEFVSSDRKALETEFHPLFSIGPVILALCGIFLAMFLYKKNNSRPDTIANAFSGIYRAAYRKFYIDEIYLFVTKKIVFNLIGRPAAWIDKNVVDGCINLSATIAENFSEAIRPAQSGKVQQYAIWFFVGVLGFSVLFIYFWTN
ncbi:MAG: NADH-quinone oxidoreductase subunit L, partial [Bacteroidia bacterium]